MTDRKSTRLNSSHLVISYAVFCLKKKKKNQISNGHQKNNNIRDRERREYLTSILHMHPAMPFVTAPFLLLICFFFFFFFNDTATTEIYTLSLHDALPIWLQRVPRHRIQRSVHQTDL